VIADLVSKLLDEAIDGAHADAAIDCGSCPGKDD
jgi:hypothetical protein